MIAAAAQATSVTLDGIDVAAAVLLVGLCLCIIGLADHSPPVTRAGVVCTIAAVLVVLIAFIAA